MQSTVTAVITITNISEGVMLVVVVVLLILMAVKVLGSLDEHSESRSLCSILLTLTTIIQHTKKSRLWVARFKK